MTISDYKIEYKIYHKYKICIWKMKILKCKFKIILYFQFLSKYVIFSIAFDVSATNLNSAHKPEKNGSVL